MTEPKNVLVLLVDDEPVLRMVAGDALMDAGFEVVEADCAEAALAILSSRSDVSVLFTDVNMPGSLDGLELARMVHQRWPAIQLVVTSGRPLPAPVPEDGRFVAKPYTLDEVTLTVAKMAGRSDDVCEDILPAAGSLTD